MDNTTREHGDYAHDESSMIDTGAMAFAIVSEGITGYEEFLQWHDEKNLQVYPGEEDFEWVKRKALEDDDWDEQRYIRSFVSEMGDRL